MLWVVIVAVIVAAAIVVWLAARSRRTSHLQERFGSEYGRVVEEQGDRRQAESELVDREKRREKLDIRPLPAEAQRRYAESWREVQARFVDAPGAAIHEADALVTSVMSERGYPMDEFDQRAADISVDHPEVVDNYRAAHGIAQRSDAGEASTEDLRQGLVHYRALFERLLDTSDRETVTEAKR
jgi:hypothetical protein